MTGGSPVTSEMVGRTCPYCRFDLEEGVSVIACPVCKAVHHDDCWEENGGCAVALCAGGPTRAETPSEEAGQVEPPIPPASTPEPLPAVVAPAPSEAPTQKAPIPPSSPGAPPPPPPGPPLPQGRSSRSQWVPLIAVAILLLGGATATAIVLTKHGDHPADHVSAGAPETEGSEFGEYEEEGEYESEYGEEGGYEEGESEEAESSSSPSQLAQLQVKRALQAHFNRLAAGHYETAYQDLTPSEGEAIGGESGWVPAQEEDQLQSFSLSVETSLIDQHTARATIVEFETHALATGCNDWSGYWEMRKIYGEWLIGAAKLEKEPC